MRLIWTFLLFAVLPFFGTGTSFGQADEERTPANFEALAKSATALRDADRPDDAIRDYRRALELRQDWAEGWWYLGTLLYDTDRYSEAIPAFRKLLNLAPNTGPTWNFLGLCEFESGDYASSLEHLKRGQELGDGDDPELGRVSKYHLALLLNRRGEFEAATSLLAAAVGQDQISSQVKLVLGLALLRVPLLPKEVDPSQDALVQGAGEAAAAIAQNDSAKALSAFTSFLRDHSDTPYLHYAYGKALASAARDQEALAQQEEETRISPGSALPWIEISQVHIRLHHLPQALHAAQQAAELAPDSSAAHRALGAVLQAMGRQEEAGKELESAAKLIPEKYSPDDRIVRLYSIHPAAESSGVLERGVDQSDPVESPSFEELSGRAAAAQAAGNTDQAIKSFQQALQLHPEWEEGRWNLAMLLYSIGHFPDAVSALKIVVERKPTFGAAWAVMGLAEYAMKDYSNALIHLQRGEQLGLGGRADAVRLAKLRLATLLNQHGQFEEAIDVLAPASGPGTLDKEIRTALGMSLLRIPLLPAQIEPESHSLVESAGELTLLLLNSKYDQAYPKFISLLKEYPTTPFLHYAYGTALVSLSQYDEAEAQFRQESQISPGSELPYLELASIALKRGRPADAVPPAQRAVELAANSSEAHYLLGRAYLDSAQEKNAIHELEAASTLAPGSPKIHFSLAKAYAKAKMPERAEEQRGIFARLNASAEQQRTRAGNQAYTAAQAAMTFTPTRAEPNKAADPQLP